MIKKLLILVPLITTLYAETPKLYKNLGDKLYYNMVNISNLADVTLMQQHQENIDNYLHQCLALQEQGLKIDQEGGDEKGYLKTLRSLAKEYEFFVRMANTTLLQTMTNNDYTGFKELIQTGLIDIDKYGDQIIGFYEIHRRGSEVIPEVESYIRYREELKAQENEAKLRRQEIYQSYKQRRVEQINRRQEEKKAAYMQSLEEERERTKEEVYEEQKQELQIKR